MMNPNTSIHILLYRKEGIDDFIRDESFASPRIVFHRADSPNDAIALLFEYDMTAIIMDVDDSTHDPFTPAIRTAALIRASERMKQIPILFLLTQVPHPDTRFNETGEGPVDYMVKPVNRNILSCKIRMFAALAGTRIKAPPRPPSSDDYRQFFENSPAAFLIIDKSGYILDINTCFIRNIARPGQDKLDYIGKDVFSSGDLLNYKLLDMCKSILSSSKSLKTDIVVSEKPLDMDRYYSVSGSPLFRNGETDGVILVYEDISERIEAESDLIRSKNELENANAELNRMTENLEQAIIKANKMAVDAEIATISKSIFLASMSHEIRTPLNAVVGFTDLMLSTRLTDEQKEYIESIRDSSQTFLGLLNDILDFSKIEANRVELENIPFNLESLLDEVLTTNSVRAYEKNIEIALRIPPDIPRRLKGDPVRLKQILVNLIGNAVKFTTRGHILVRVSCVSKTSTHIQVRFSISDTGIGIPQNKLERIFEPFSQAADSTTREFGGTGLGLAITKKLAELMNGVILVESPNPESAETSGSIFHVDVSLGIAPVPAMPSPIPHRETVIGKKAALLSGSRVLCDFYESVIKDTGLDVTPLPDLYQAIDFMGSPQPQAPSHVFIDDTLPFSSIETFISSGCEKNNYKGEIVLLMSPYSRMDRELKDRFPRISCIRKPLKLSNIYKVLTSNEDRDTTGKSTPENHESPDSAMSPLNILLVEDNHINQKVTTKMLKKMGHTVTVANNGNEALEILHGAGGFDLILMDGQMPVMDGFKATETIRRNEKASPDAQRIPIIALTANAMKGDRIRYLNAGMDDYIAKPVKYGDLYAMILTIMERKKSGNLGPKAHLTIPEVSEF
jgi:PAS domain S-box-containing protein